MRVLSRTLAALGAAGVMIIAGPAFAAGPYTISAGSQTSGPVPFTATSGQIKFDTSSGLNLTCVSGSAGGNVNTGTNAKGLAIAIIGRSFFNRCDGPLGLPLTVKQTAPWRLNATGPAGTVTAGSIDKIAATVSNPDGQCSFNVAGAVNVKFSSSVQKLFVAPGALKLTVSNVSGCFGLISNGDTASFTATYLIKNNVGPIKIA